MSKSGESSTQYCPLPSLTYVNLVMPIITRGKSGGAIITESVEKK